MRNKKESGFTLIEIITVVVIIVILAKLITTSLQTARQKAYQTKTRAFVANIAMAVKAYEIDWGAYPGLSGYNSTPGEQTAATAQQQSTALYFLLATPFKAGTAVGSLPAGSSLGTPSRSAGPYLSLKESDYTGTAPDRSLVDHWGRAFRYYYDADYDPATTPPVHNTSSFDVYSAGEDGTMGNTDDIGNW